MVGRNVSHLGLTNGPTLPRNVHGGEEDGSPCPVAHQGVGPTPTYPLPRVILHCRRGCTPPDYVDVVTSLCSRTTPWSSRFLDEHTERSGESSVDLGSGE